MHFQLRSQKPRFEIKLVLVSFLSFPHLAQRCHFYTTSVPTILGVLLFGGNSQIIPQFFLGCSLYVFKSSFSQLLTTFPYKWTRSLFQDSEYSRTILSNRSLANSYLNGSFIPILEVDYYVPSMLSAKSVKLKDNVQLRNRVCL